MLTRIIYEAIDARGQWNPIPSQNEWLRLTGDEEDEIPTAPPVSTRMKRKLETVKEEEEEEVEKPKKKGKVKVVPPVKETKSQKSARIERLLESFRMERAQFTKVVYRMMKNVS